MFADEGSESGSSESGIDCSETTSRSQGTSKMENKTESSDGISTEGKRAVVWSKVLVLTILAIAAAGVGFATYKATTTQEQTVFETQVRLLTKNQGCYNYQVIISTNVIISLTSTTVCRLQP